MSKSRSRTSGFSIPPPASAPRLLLVGKKGPAFTGTCPDYAGFDTVVIRRNGRSTTVRCTCQLEAAA
ncbi:hypothetical protein [Streptomyces sp. ICN441]|uniref:hypothetical protein n=1 Tax=Streptomyces sp. ICN441 TaxID=2558286 RepID=UPI00141B38CF|nr:hypothetical protein [Streptomyces sp. ICN441]